MGRIRAIDLIDGDARFVKDETMCSITDQEYGDVNPRDELGWRARGAYSLTEGAA